MQVVTCNGNQKNYIFLFKSATWLQMFDLDPTNCISCKRAIVMSNLEYCAFI